MRLSAFQLTAAILLCASSALAQAHGLGPKDTFAAARLSAKEVREITDGVEQSAFDTPDSWESELRVRRVDLGNGSGIVVQGTKLLCGGTGNCQIFVFRRVGQDWVPLFAGEEAPVVEGFSFGPEATRGIKDLHVQANSSADKSSSGTYRFDGKFYRAAK